MFPNLTFFEKKNFFDTARAEPGSFLFLVSNHPARCPDGRRSTRTTLQASLFARQTLQAALRDTMQERTYRGGLTSRTRSSQVKQKLCCPLRLLSVHRSKFFSEAAAVGGSAHVCGCSQHPSPKLRQNSRQKSAPQATRWKATCSLCCVLFVPTAVCSLSLSRRATLLL